MQFNFINSSFKLSNQKINELKNTKTFNQNSTQQINNKTDFPKSESLKQNTQTRENLSTAYWMIYSDDYKTTNSNLKKNQFANNGELSTKNNSKTIANKDEAKEYLSSFLEKLTKQLKKLGIYDKDMQNTLKYVEEKFNLDKYFEDYQNPKATEFERDFLQAIISSIDNNEIMSKYLTN